MFFRLEMILRLLLAAFLGGIIGYEREIEEKPAGLRTHMLLAMGSTIFTMLSYSAFPGSDPSRVAASIIVGIGFIGAGTIYQQRDKIVGLTTAVSLWVTTAIGMSIGTGFYLLGVITTLVTFLILSLKIFERKVKS